MSRFDWDPAKNRENLRKHGVGFQTASLVFQYPLKLRGFFHARIYRTATRKNATTLSEKLAQARFYLWSIRGGNKMEKRSFV